MPAVEYIAVIFSSVRTTEDGVGYSSMASAMEEMATKQPGYCGIESVFEPSTRHGITISYWASEADAVAWKQVGEHLGAQRLGREQWYESYRTRVATVTREYDWER